MSAAVWLVREDDIDGGQIGPVTIRVDYREPLDATAARRLAAERVAAAELAAVSQA